MATIATHNGSKICRDHNIRNPKVIEKEKHIDPNGVYEIWHDEKIREAYKRIFGAAQREYNERQTREDRKIKSYYNRVAKDAKKHVGYEMIAGVYGKEVDPEIGKEILREFVGDWKTRNPTLELIGVYYHADEEGQPHVHIDYIPVGHGYAKGMSVQNGLNKALEEIGFKTLSKAETAQIQWERRENQHLEKLCRQRGINVERPTAEKKQHEETQEYKVRKQVENLEEKKITLESEIEALRAQKGPIGRIGPLRQENDALKQEKAALEETVREVREKLREKEIDVKALEAKIEILQPSMDDYIKEIEDMQEKEHLQRTVEWLRKVLEEIKRFLQEHAPAVYSALKQNFEKAERGDHER